MLVILQLGNRNAAIGSWIATGTWTLTSFLEQVSVSSSSFPPVKTLKPSPSTSLSSIEDHAVRASLCGVGTQL